MFTLRHLRRNSCFDFKFLRYPIYLRAFNHREFLQKSHFQLIKFLPRTQYSWINKFQFKFNLLQPNLLHREIDGLIIQ